MTKIIVLDPAHGGSDSGASDNGMKEKDISLDISKRTKAYLENNYTGVKVLLTRSSDKAISLQYRTDFANRNKADCFVSPHVNAGGGTGFESYVMAGAHPDSAGKLQRLIHEEMSPVLKKHGLRDRGKKYDNQSQHSRLHVLRATKMKACLTENFFIDTKKDADLLKSTSFRQEVAEAHARAIARTAGLKKRTVSIPNPDPKPRSGTAKYRVQAGAFGSKANADRRVTELKRKGFDAFATKQGSLYLIQAGAFAEKKNADGRAAAIQKAGIEAIVVAI